MDASLTDISSILQCKVCLRRLRDPKLLYPCHHIFCKECIEGVMRFRQNGSIDIPCPLRCPKRMHLKKDQTISDLGTAYEIKAIIETLEKGNSSLEGRVLGCKTGGCQREVSMHCCGQKLCSECYKEHAALSLTLICSLAQPIGVDDYTGQMIAICRVHSIKCSHVCRTCSSGKYVCFICIYCLNRDHNQHTVDTVEDCASKVKQSLKKNYANSQMLDKVKEATEKTVEVCSLKLDKWLQQRKRECVSKYIDHILAEEEKIKKQFKQRSEEHLRSLPTTETHSKLFEDEVSEDGLSLILDKSTFLNDFSHATYTECLRVSNSNGNDFHSLGTLELNSGEIPPSSIGAAALSTLEDNITVPEVRKEDSVLAFNYDKYELQQLSVSVPRCKELCQMKEDPDGFTLTRIDDTIGYGIFTTKYVHKNQVLLEYKGKLVTREESKHLHEEYERNGVDCYIVNFFHNNEILCIDATMATRTLGRFVNDSPQRYANCEMKKHLVDNVPHLFFVATKYIPAFVELRYDYGDHRRNRHWRGPSHNEKPLSLFEDVIPKWKNKPSSSKSRSSLEIMNSNVEDDTGCKNDSLEDVIEAKGVGTIANVNGEVTAGNKHGRL